MSAIASPPRAWESSGSGATVPPSAGGESCPLCRAPLDPEQDWCMRCGAAARTRLAAAPNWKVPTVVLALVVALSLGVLAAALVALTGRPAPPARTATVIVRTAPAVTPPTTSPPTAVTPTTAAPPATAGATAPGAATGGATGGAGSATAPSTAAGASAGVGAARLGLGAARRRALQRRLRELGRPTGK